VTVRRDDPAAIPNREEEPIERVAPETIVLELYRRGTISRGTAAALRGVPRSDFVRRASRPGIPSCNPTPEGLDAELGAIRPPG